MILACPMSLQTLSFSSLFYISDIPTCHIPYSSQSAIPDNQLLHLSQVNAQLGGMTPLCPCTENLLLA